MDLAFRHAVAPFQREPGLNGDQISMQPTGEAGQLPDPAVRRLTIHASRL